MAATGPKHPVLVPQALLVLQHPPPVISDQTLRYTITMGTKQKDDVIGHCAVTSTNGAVLEPQDPPWDPCVVQLRPIPGDSPMIGGLECPL